MRAPLIAVVALALSCGGSDGGGTTAAPPPPTPACTPIAGTWHLTDTLSSTSSSFCAASFRTDTSTVSLAASGASTFTWTETSSSGSTFVVNGTGNISGVCAANITLSLSGTINQPTYQITLIGSRSVAFQNNTMSGTSQVTLTTSPIQAGTPCTALFSTIAAR